MTTAPLAADILSLSTDARGIVTSCNSAVEELLGRPRVALIGHPVPMDVFDRDQLEQRAAAAGVPPGPPLLVVDPRRFERRRDPRLRLGDLDRRRSRPQTEPERTQPGAGGKAVGRRCSWNVTDADGARRVLSLTVRALLHPSGVVCGYVAQGVDVTEEQRTSDLLAQALQREQEVTRRHLELDQLRNDFVTTAGHELRTPLTNILGFVELLESGTDDPERRHRFASAIRRNVVRLQDLAEGLVILSNSTSDHVRPCSTLDLRDVVEAVRVNVPRDGSSSSIVPEFECPDRPVEVHGNAARLEQVVLHLVENAVTFTPPGGHVSCRVGRSSGEATIEVADTGPGVPPSELPHLFSPFFRGAASQEGAVPGSGLGLSIVAAVVEEHAGRLLVTDNEPRGTVFTVRLPAAP